MLNTNLVHPQELTGFVRGLTFPQVNALAPFLPKTERMEIEYAFVRTDQARREIAQYRPFDVESPIGDRPGMARVRGRIPPMSKKMVLGEEEQLLVDALKRQQVLSQEMEDQIYNDARMLTEDLTGRIEYARGQVLSTGKVSFTSDLGFVSAEIDYGIPGANFVTTPGADWDSPATAVPITDMQAWLTNVYMPANSNRRPVVGLCSTKTLLLLQQNTQIRNFIVVGGAVGSTLPILTTAQVNTVLQTQNLPPLVAIDEIVNVGGVATRVLPENVVVFLPAPSADRFGETAYGPTVEALRLARAGFIPVPTAPGLTGVNMDTFDPEHTWTKVAGLVVPVLKDPNAVLVATVYV